MIIETIVTTVSRDGTPHIAPMGIRHQDGRVVLAPFRPSSTLENLKSTPFAVVNLTDDVRVFAGCLAGRAEWSTRPATHITGHVLAQALTHWELEVEVMDDDAVRPRFHCRQVHAASHGPFRGFNRGQAAVIEAAILVSRLERLPAEKIDREMEYLSIAVEKTGGPQEREAWGWLVERIAEFRQASKL